jgi:hypothetical protein
MKVIYKVKHFFIFNFTPDMSLYLKNEILQLRLSTGGAKKAPPFKLLPLLT